MTAPVETTSQQQFRDDLIRYGHFLPSGERGIYGRGMEFEEVRSSFDELITRTGAEDRPECPRFPLLFPVEL